MARTSWAMEGRPGFSTRLPALAEPVVVTADADVDARARTETERRPEDDVRLGQVVEQEQCRVAVVGQARLHERVLEPIPLRRAVQTRGGRRPMAPSTPVAASHPCAVAARRHSRVQVTFGRPPRPGCSARRSTAPRPRGTARRTRTRGRPRPSSRAQSGRRSVGIPAARPPTGARPRPARDR